MQTQLAVLGGGPGGYAAAFLAADLGMQVTLVDAEPQLGGTCLLRGCIPSKALLHLARVMAEVEELAGGWGVRYGAPAIDLAQLRARQQKLLATLAGGLKQLARRRKVTVITARGVLEDSTTLRLEGEDPSIPQGGRLCFEHLILATGSRPIVPENLRVDSPLVMGSAAALQLAEIPRTLLVIGGGYIGLEMATIYARLGAQVTIVELLDGLLPGVDRDLVKPLHRRMNQWLGGRIHLKTEVVRLREVEGQVEAELQGPELSGLQRFDRVLVAVGRRPNSERLGLEQTQVQRDAHGFVQCDLQGRTDDPHILAVGDVAGQPLLAHKATHQGRVAAEALAGQPAAFDKQAIPAVVFTDPEIAWAGLTQQQAADQGRAVEVALFPWAASGRAHAVGRTEGLTKWIIEPGSHRILGCGMVGPGAGELIAEAVLAIEMGCQIRDVADSIHPHPTLSETLMNAAEVALGTATDIYKPKRQT